MDQNKELQTLIGNLKQTKDPIAEIDAQRAFLAGRIANKKIGVEEYIRRCDLLLMAKDKFEEET